MSSALTSTVLLLLVIWTVVFKHSDALSGRPHAKRHDVTSYGASGDGLADDTHAIDSAISALKRGSQLFFPCGTYMVSSALTPITVSNVTVAGAPGCVTIHGTGSGYTIMRIGSASLSSFTPLSATANELSTTALVASASETRPPYSSPFPR